MIALSPVIKVPLLFANLRCVGLILPDAQVIFSRVPFINYVDKIGKQMELEMSMIRRFSLITVKEFLVRHKLSDEYYKR